MQNIIKLIRNFLSSIFSKKKPKVSLREGLKPAVGKISISRSTYADVTDALSDPIVVRCLLKSKSALTKRKKGIKKASKDLKVRK
jgi:hypothetical protein